MNTKDLKQIDASLSELGLIEQQEVAGGSFLSYAAGYVVGYTIGVGVAIVASATLAVQVLSGDNLSNTAVDRAA